LAIKLSKAGIPDGEIDWLENIELMELVNDSVALELKELRDTWVDRFSDYRPAIIRHRINDEGLRLTKAIEDALADKLKATRYGVSGVLHRYRDSFQSHQARAKLTVHEYAMVVGATCQQSASVSMASLKNLSGIGDSGISFDTVIIDEAARANPLDLFIPMSMAEKRVILVGDHRQLPHLLEPAVESEMAEIQNFTEEQGKALHDSLFERLWKQLKDREVIDGFPRVVMLDTQFRMHPILGNFISEQFYESVGLAKLKPGKEANDFPSDTPGFEGKVCAWINVPHLPGNSERRLGTSRSWTRNDEAQVVAKEAVRLLNSCDAHTTIGIITFYSAQRDLIFEHLAQVGIAERDPDTQGWRISPSWQMTAGGEERFRVGTVDGFQGKEFDIVLLSIVRSNTENIPTQTPDNLSQFESAANRKYGHLRLDNRMNVAMSRQRRLLISVGDKQMAIGANAEVAVPALSSFLKMCGGPDGIVR
jgi:superfamily I DNA and/or RNA helicase